MKTRSHRWLIWLLPLLVARAFVPAGFMLSAHDGGLSLTFCPSVESAVQSPTQTQQDVAAHEHHHAHAEHQHHQSHSGSNGEQQHANHFGASDTGVCPFGFIAAACSSGEFYVASNPTDSVAERIPDYSAPPETNRPIHADRIRGPPPASLT